MAITIELETPPLWAFHLPGQHNQATHGHGKDGYVAGADLLADDHTAYSEDLLRQVRGRTRSGGGNYGPNGNEPGYAIAESQGFERKPKVVTGTELDAAVAGGSIELHRQINDGIDYEGRRRSAAEFAEQFRSGPMYAGSGIYGNGTYTYRSTSKEVPSGHLRMALRPEARVGKVDAVSAEHRQWMSSLGENAPQRELFYDVGHYAAARGYDALEVPDGTFVVLNRTAVIVQEA